MSAENRMDFALIGAALLVAGVGFWVWKKGGIGGAAAAAASGAVRAAGGAVAGAASAAGEVVGLPTMDQTTQDPAVARWVIDQYGYFEASKWASAGALFQASIMGSDTGYPPPQNSALGIAIRAGALGSAKGIDTEGQDNGTGWD